MNSIKYSARVLQIKPKAHGIAVAKELSELYPDMKHLYMYRDPKEYVRSLCTVYRSLMHPIVRSLLLYMSFGMGMQVLFYNFALACYVMTHETHAVSPIDSNRAIVFKHHFKRKI